MTRQEAADALDEIGLGVVGDDLMDGATPTELIRDLQYHWSHSDKDEQAREAFAFAEKVLVALRHEEHTARAQETPPVPAGDPAIAARIVVRASTLVGQPGPYAPMGIEAAIMRAMEEVEDEDDQVGQYKENSGLASNAIYWAQTRYLGTRTQPYWPADDYTERRVGRQEMEEREREILRVAYDHLTGII